MTQSTPWLRQFANAEWKSIRRDSMLRGMLVILLVLGGLTRWLVPWISAHFEVDLTPHYPLVMSAIVVFLAPVFAGFIVGMLLLEERDAGTLQAIRVTPIPLWRYLAWKLSMPTVLSTLFTIAMFPIAGLMPFRWTYWLAVIVGALWAPLLALLMSCFARNKLQGFVLMRISNVLLVIPVLAWFAPRFEPALAVFPAYWPMKSLWLAAAGQSTMVVFAVGLAFHLVLIIVLYRKFRTVASV